MYSRLTYDSIASLCPCQYLAFSEALDGVDDNDNSCYLLGERYKIACDNYRNTAKLDPAEFPKEYALAHAVDCLIAALRRKGVPAEAGVIDNDTEVSFEFVIEKDAIYDRKLSKKGKEIAGILGVKKFEDCPDVEV